MKLYTHWYTRQHFHQYLMKTWCAIKYLRTRAPTDIYWLLFRLWHYWLLRRKPIFLFWNCSVFRGDDRSCIQFPISEDDIFCLYSTKLPSNFSGGCTQTDSPASSSTPNSSKMYGMSTLIKIIFVAAMLFILLSYAQDSADISITQYIDNPCNNYEGGTTQIKSIH